ncbi:MAG: hypothetical protein IT436_03585 [Phycisphaerales bacterium]|nr:hypothetical protein [Phycisphaerales bacterium]
MSSKPHNRSAGNQTVFVIGAGASAAPPFKLPTAKQLYDEIIATPPLMWEQDPRDTFRDRQQHLRSVAHEKAKQFSTALKHAGLGSVDRFLELNPQWSEYGKFCIAKRLLLLERDVLWKRTAADHWHSWLIQRLLRRPEQLTDGSVTFITFNYDRLLYFAFYHMIRYALNRTHADAWNLASKIPIVHVYGSLLFDYEKIFAERYDINFEVNIRTVMHSATGIRLMTTERDAVADDSVVRCRNAIAKASRIVFLGFGFDCVNIKRLGAQGIGDSCSVSSTAYGLEDGEQRRIRNLIGSDIVLGKDKHDCLDFLRDTAAEWIDV